MGLPHIPHTITYTTNDTAFKNKLKSNDAIPLVTGVLFVTSFYKTFNYGISYINKNACISFFQ